ncbi:MAG: hypothetical protein KIS66_15695 [Fimbriimonadaceae bacterium]|nr:hypothetical protein [Fimbriimonadaceae bacterium]
MTSELVRNASLAALGVLALAVLVAMVRLVKGPSLPDRVVAVDLVGMLAAGMIGVLSIYAGNGVYVDVAIVIALISFLATVAIARYIERREVR